MPEAQNECLLLSGDDGAVYAIPRHALEQYRIEDNEEDEVKGYLNPQPLPPKTPPPGWQLLGMMPIRPFTHKQS